LEYFLLEVHLLAGVHLPHLGLDHFEEVLIGEDAWAVGLSAPIAAFANGDVWWHRNRRSSRDWCGYGSYHCTRGTGTGGACRAGGVAHHGYVIVLFGFEAVAGGNFGGGAAAA